MKKTKRAAAPQAAPRRKRPTPEHAQRFFEKRLLEAEKMGVRCNLRGMAAGACDSVHDRHWCWIGVWSVLFQALRYAREHGLVSIPDPWEDRAWMDAPAAPLSRKRARRPLSERSEKKEKE